MADYRLRGTFRLLSPLSHISEAISTTSYLVEEPILQEDGSIADVFVYSGNAWRGQLRDLAAEYLIDRLKIKQIGLESFHLLFAGGRIGGKQAVDLEAARALRKALPLLAIFGGGVGNQILPGKLRFYQSYLVCAEASRCLFPWLRDAAKARPYRGLAFEKSYTRRDDSKHPDRKELLAGQPQEQKQLPGSTAKSEDGVDKGTPAQQMRMTMELIAAGSELQTGIDLLGASEAELGCLVSALHRFSASPFIGGRVATGHGHVELDYNLDGPDGDAFLSVGQGAALLSEAAEEAKAAYDEHVLDLYHQWIEERSEEIVHLLGERK